MEKTIKRKKNRKANYGSRIGLADRVNQIEKQLMRTDLPDFQTGDTVKVHVRIKEGEKERVQAYEGVVIARSNRGSGKSFTVRKMSHGVGVERIFLESSPKVARVEIVQPGKSRRSKLYYLRALQGKAAKLDRELERTSEETPAVTASAEAPAKATAKPAAKK